MKQTRTDFAVEQTDDYVGSFVYEDGTLKYLLTDEGRVIVNTNGTYEYQYSLKDHLGNTRITFNQNGQIIQEDAYYPFGMKMNGLCFQSGVDYENMYLYNGKELQDEFGLDWYDYEARFYDPQLGVLHTVDPHAENYYSWSPYHYVANNPINLIDPDGQDWYQWKDDKGSQAVAWREGDAKNLDINGQNYSNIGTSYTQDIGNNTSITFTQNDAVSMTETVLNKGDFKSQMTGNILSNGKFEKKAGEEGECFYQAGEMVKVSGAVSRNGDGNSEKDAQKGLDYINSQIDNGHSTRVQVDRNGDDTGDHWVATSSRTTDLKTQKSTIGYFDPAGRNLKEGTGSSFNQGTDGKLKGVASAYNARTIYKVVNVRRNNK